MKNFVYSIVAAALMTAPALAADVAPVTHDWTGVYAGIVGGAVSQTTDTADYWCWSACDVPQYGKINALAGGTLGYNYQLDDNFVIGVEGDFTSGTSSDSSQKDDNYNNPQPQKYQWNADINWLATVRARAGLAVGNTMAYVTGGLAIDDASYEAKSTGPESYENYKADWSGTQFGLTAGVGIEHAFTEHMTAKIEYLYTAFPEESGCYKRAGDKTCSDAKYPPSNTDGVHWNTTLSSVRVGLNYAF